MLPRDVILANFSYFTIYIGLLVGSNSSRRVIRSEEVDVMTTETETTSPAGEAGDTGRLLGVVFARHGSQRLKTMVLV